MGLSTGTGLWGQTEGLWGGTEGLAPGSGLSPIPPQSKGITTDAGVQITTDSGQAIETSN